MSLTLLLHPLDGPVDGRPGCGHSFRGRFKEDLSSPGPCATPSTIHSVLLTLREYRQTDFETLWRIDQQCFEPGIAYSQRELMAYVRLRGSFTLVSMLATEGIQSAQHPETPPQAADEGKIVGFLVAHTNRSGLGHIITVDVLPQARRLGVGSKLLQVAEDRLQAMNCRSVVLETAVNNAPALAFYKRHQYLVVRTAPGYYANGLDALVLEKDLLSTSRAG